MNSKQLESLIKEALSNYKQDYNEVNSQDPIDFILEVVPQRFDPKKVNREGLSDEAIKDLDKKVEQDLFYLRLSKVFEKRTEQRVIFVAYRPVDLFKTKDLAVKSLYRECLDHLIVAGIEYTEALYIMSEESKKVEEIVEKDLDDNASDKVSETLSNG